MFALRAGLAAAPLAHAHGVIDFYDMKIPKALLFSLISAVLVFCISLFQCFASVITMIGVGFRFLDHEGEYPPDVMGQLDILEFQIIWAGCSTILSFIIIVCLAYYVYKNKNQ